MLSLPGTTNQPSPPPLLLLLSVVVVVVVVWESVVSASVEVKPVGSEVEGIVVCPRLEIGKKNATRNISWHFMLLLDGH